MGDLWANALAHRPLPTDRARREGRLAAYPCSDESCRVFSAHYLGWILREGEVLASRQALQSTGVVDVDCPVCLGVCLGVLKAGEGVVTFHILECGHRCAAPPFPLALLSGNEEHAGGARAPLF